MRLPCPGPSDDTGFHGGDSGQAGPEEEDAQASPDHEWAPQHDAGPEGADGTLPLFNLDIKLKARSLPAAPPPPAGFMRVSVFHEYCVVYFVLCSERGPSRNSVLRKRRPGGCRAAVWRDT